MPNQFSARGLPNLVAVIWRIASRFIGVSLHSNGREPVRMLPQGIEIKSKIVSFAAPAPPCALPLCTTARRIGMHFVTRLAADQALRALWANGAETDNWLARRPPFWAK